MDFKHPLWTALVTFSFLFLSQAASAQHNFANWTSNTSFTLNGATATASTINAIDINSSMLTNFNTVDGALNYPDVWFTPVPVVGLLWSLGGVDNALAGTTGSVDVSISFDMPVNNPRFHFLNLDNATVSFTGITLGALSGNPLFDVSAGDINLVPQAATVGGCADAASMGSNGACGTVELPGSYTSITFTVLDNDTNIGSGDGFAWTVSADAGPILPAPANVPTLSASGLILLALLLLGLGAFLVPKQKFAQK